MITKEKIQEATAEGLLVFWQKIADHFPNAESGDFPPELDIEMTKYLEKMVKRWIMFNL